MPIYMALHHRVEGLTTEAVEGAHAVRTEAHGLVADDVSEVREGASRAIRAA